MKYSYEFIIRDEKEDSKIIEIFGRGVSRSTKGCLKSVRRDINSSIKSYIDGIEEEEAKKALLKAIEEIVAETEESNA